MLRPVGDSRIYIGEPTLADPQSLPDADWAAISHAESLGTLGVSWDVVEAHTMSSAGHAELPHIAKSTRRSNIMQIVLGADDVDAGQLRLWQAVRSDEPFPFRMLIPDGQGGWSARYWTALVTSLEEAFDSANLVIKLIAELRPTSELIRSNEEVSHGG